MTNPKPKLIRRHFLGIQVSASGKACPTAHAVYEEVYSDGSSKAVRGHSLYTLPNFNLLNAKSKKAKKWAKDEYAPELYTLMEAAAILNDTISRACMWLDKERGMGEF